MRIHRDVRPPQRRAMPVFEPGLLALCLLCGAAPALGQSGSISAPSSPKAETVTTDVIDARQKEAAKSKDLDEATRSKALEFYRQAAEALTAADGFAKQAAASKWKIQGAPQAAADAKSDQKRLRESAELSEAAGRTKPADNRTVGALEIELVEARTSLEPLLKRQGGLEKEPTRRANRRKEIRELLLAARTDGRDLRKQIAAVAPKDEPSLLSLARRTALQARLQCLDQEVPALEAELARYEAEDAVELVRLKRDLLAQQIALAEQRIKKLTESADQARRLEAERAVAEARRMQVEAHPLLRSLAAENTALAMELQSLTKPIESAEHELTKARNVSDQLSEQFAKTREKAAGVGLTKPVGQLLRKQRAELKDPAELQRSVDVRSQAIDEAQFRLYELEENRSGLADPEPVIRLILGQAPPGLSAESRKILEKAARDILESKQQLLDQLNRNLSSYYETQLELVITQRRLIELINAYANYIDERVLWIRSSRPLGISELYSGKPIRWLKSSANWGQVADALAFDARSNPLAPIGFLLLIGVFWYTRRRFHSEIGKLGHDAHRTNYTRFLPTSRAFFLTLFTSVLGAGILWYVGWRLAAAAYDVDFPSAISDGLFAAALLYLPLDLVRRTCRPDGLAAHFGWSPDSVRTLANDARWLMVLGLPVTFVTELLHSSDPDSSRTALERLLMAAGLVLIAVFHLRVLRPHSQLVRQLVPHAHDDWVKRLQAVCRAVGVGGPLVLSVLVVAGYDYTARQFVWRLYLTAIAGLASYYARALLLRWILIHRRLMGMQRVKERRVTELRSTLSADASAPAAVHAEPAEKIDLAALSEQTRTLVNVGILSTLFVGLWWIWLDVFPSMGILNHIELGWSTTVGDRVEPITMANLLVAAFIIALTWISVRNIPGLLEMTVLERLRIDAAGRFAFSALARYGIVVIGLVSASSTIGIGWTKVQWLATALTFGLAFGLQEIFANFIAGLIILFERPVRVGDMVTIENVTGVVSRIRIRATTITDSDRKEFIVPNKEFITGRTLNWTLSDTINRIVINVGLAYGSDTEMVREILLKAAHEHPAVLRDPAPSASFEEFGETSLRLVLRCFLPNLTERTRVIHELHTAINRELTVHGIEISAPHADSTVKPTLPLVTSRKADSTTEPHARVAG